MTEANLDDRAAELRRAFDRSFVEPFQDAREDAEALLGVRVADAAYALRLAELAGLAEARRIVPVPSAAPAFLGLAGIRGAVTPVYGLHRILGHPPSRERPRWIVLAREELVGLAFDALDEHMLVLRSEISLVQGEVSQGHVREVARSATMMRPIVCIRSILGALRSQIGIAGTVKER